MSSNDPPGSSSFRSIIIGSCFVTLGQILFATSAAIVKYSGLKESQLLFGRYAIHLLISICYWIILKQTKPSHQMRNWYGDKPYIQSVWLRGVTFTLNLLCYWYAMIRLPIGDAECIFYQTPIVIAMFGWLFLKEPLPKMTPLICIIGTAGVLCMSQPQFFTQFCIKMLSITSAKDVEALNVDGILSMLSAMCFWSVTAVLIRKAKGSHFLQLDIVSGAVTLFIALPFLLVLNNYLHNRYIGDLDLKDWSFDTRSVVLLVLLGVVGFGGLTCSVIGYQYAEATKVSWMEYLTLPIAFLYQIFLFNDTPNPFEIIGVVLVLFACCISLLEEAYKKYKNETISYSALQTITTSQSEYESPSE